MSNMSPHGITLADFRPQPQQEELLRAMTDSRLHQALVLHANRSGASTAAAAWIASMATDRPITTNTGESLFMRPDSLRGIPLTLWCVASDWIAIKEQVTGILLPVVSEGQLGMISMQNFLSSGFKTLDGIVWEDKRGGILKSITIRNGTRIVFQPSSNIDWMSGERIHGVWIDETMRDHAVYNELLMRSIDDGRLIWTVSPSMLDAKVSPSNPDVTIAKVVEQTQRTPYAARVFRFKPKQLVHNSAMLDLPAAPDTISLLTERVAKLEQQMRQYTHESDCG